MKNFDIERQGKRRSREERTFQIGGETFVAKAENHPDVLAGYDQITDGTSITETLEIVDSILVQMLEPEADAVSRYRALRARREDPITVEDLMTIMAWLMSLETGGVQDDNAQAAPAAGPSMAMPTTQAAPTPTIPQAAVPA